MGRSNGMENLQQIPKDSPNVHGRPWTDDTGQHYKICLIDANIQWVPQNPAKFDAVTMDIMLATRSLSQTDRDQLQYAVGEFPYPQPKRKQRTATNGPRAQPPAQQQPAAQPAAQPTAQPAPQQKPAASPSAPAPKKKD